MFLKKETFGQIATVTTEVGVSLAGAKGVKRPERCEGEGKNMS